MVGLLAVVALKRGLALDPASGPRGRADLHEHPLALGQRLVVEQTIITVP